MFASAACGDDEANLFGEKCAPCWRIIACGAIPKQPETMNGGLCSIGAVDGKKG